MVARVDSLPRRYYSAGPTRQPLAEVSIDLGHTPPVKPVQRREASEGDVRALAVVVGDEEHDRKVALWFGVKGLAVQALVLDRAVEPLDPAVRPGVVRLGPGVADPERRCALVERPLVPRPVVGEDPLDPDALGVEGRERVLEEPDRVGVSAARPQLGDDHPARQIDGDVQLAPADLLAEAPGVASSAAAVQTAQALGVHRDQLAGGLHVEAPDVPLWCGV